MRVVQIFRGARGGLVREDTEEAMNDRGHRFTGGLERGVGDGGGFHESDEEMFIFIICVSLKWERLHFLYI